LGPFLNLIQIVISIALIVLIILQTKGSGLGGLFGGSDSGGVYTTRRGVEKTMFNATIGLSVAFFIVAILNVIVAG
jgi:preprotein translocase subunit SecG